MKKTILILMTGTIAFTACKKDHEKTTQEKIEGKWALVTEVNNEYYNGVLYANTYTGVSTDYVDFRSDGKVYSQNGTSRDTASYTVLSDKYIKIDTDSAEIKTLTDNSFVLYSKQVYGANYFESTTTLKK